MARKPAGRTARTNKHPAALVPDSDQLSPSDEAALDRAWARISPKEIAKSERGVKPFKPQLPPR